MLRSIRPTAMSLIAGNVLLAILLIGLAAFGAKAPAFLSYQTPSAQERAAMWKKVDEALNKGLPKSALEEIKPILAGALHDKEYAEAIKAIAKRIAIEGEIEGGSPAERIARMKKELETAPPEMRSAMHALMGYWYWAYFQENRWLFANRSATESAPSDDFTTWDLKRLFAEIDKHYTAALEDEAGLQKTPIALYDALLQKGDLPDTYRPTLYDFLAFVAIDFYASGEQAGAKREDAFELDASSPILGTVEDFLAWDPKTTDSDSPQLKAIRLFQKLLRFHQSDADRSAWLDAELGRLQFGFANAQGDEGKSRTKVALKAFANKFSDHELSSLARYRLAEILQSESDLVEAREVAQQGANAFPESAGGALCFNLVQNLEAKSVTVQTERVWNKPSSSIRVSYRNIDKIYFRAVRSDWQSRFSRDHWQSEQFNQKDIAEFVTKPSVRNWSADLEPTDDYHVNSSDLAAPTDLPAGYYFILYSTRENFKDVDNIVGACEVWVTDLALVVRQVSNGSLISGFVLNNQTGEPIDEATIRAFTRDENTYKLKLEKTLTTDKNGMFEFTSQNRGVILLASHHGQELAAGQEYATYNQPNIEPGINVALFTDRSIYRPGQMVHVKGVAMIASTKTNKYEVVPSRAFQLQFRDINGKEIETLQVRSNDFGSFSGTFTAPRDRGTGQMSVSVIDVQNSFAAVRVEEYKRPKFQVTIDPMRDTAKLDQVVHVTGKAIAYTGAPIQAGRVRYRVTRQVRWPNWFMFCYPWRIAPNLGQAQEIAHGWSDTSEDGSFAIDFIAKPDRSVPESDQPIFTYAITADVTDGTGETRTGNTSVSVGYTTLQASMGADEWQSVGREIKVRINTSNLSGVSMPAEGTIKVHRLKEPETIERPNLFGPAMVRPTRGKGGTRNRQGAGGLPPIPPIGVSDPADFKNWPVADMVFDSTFKTAADGTSEFGLQLPRGIYRILLESQDAFGKPVKSELNLKVIDDEAKTLGLKLPYMFVAQPKAFEPGTSWKGIWGSGYDKARAFVEVLHRGKVLQKYWTPVDATQTTIEQQIDESMRGGVSIRVTMVRDNRLYSTNHHVDVPWTNKSLKLRWEKFRSKLEPGAKESWSLKISGPDATIAAAEFAAAMHDSSLDAFLPHSWLSQFNVFYSEYDSSYPAFQNYAKSFNQLSGYFNTRHKAVMQSYRRFPEDLRSTPMPLFLRRQRGGMPGAPGGLMPEMAMAPAAANFAEDSPMRKNAAVAEGDAGRFSVGVVNADLGISGQVQLDEVGQPGGAAGAASLGNVAPRKNLNETAFFFPQLTTDRDGVVKLEFTMPEALTTWRFLGFAHDTELRSGALFDQVVSAKDLMVQPNPPRFLREGDVIEFSAKVTNQSENAQSGRVALKLTDAISEVSVDEAYGNLANEQLFALAPKQSKSFRWKLAVPDGAKPIIYTTVAATEKMSDGEQGMLPVLSNRVLVTESIPLPIRGNTKKEFELKKLLESGDSKTIRNQSLTLQMTSQPAWYAVLALPYLMEYPYDCSEQTFNRLYANSLARHVAQSDPKIQRVFEVWRQLQPDALKSPLEKNEDLKGVMIEETPWLRDAIKESQSRRNVGILFDNNRLDTEVNAAITKLAQMQRQNGMWPWFPGGPDNEYLSLYIVTGFGRLRHLGVRIDESIALRALERLDAWMHEWYDRIPADDRIVEKNHLSSTIALYLYGRSFFLGDRAVAQEHAVPFRFWQDQARSHWLQINRQSQAHIAVALKRMGDKEVPAAIVKSLNERSVSNEEMGMFWRDAERSWWWYHAPIETQAMMVEAFDEVADDQRAVEECKVWLLKQKQTQNWKTTKATADAVYALLRRGNNWLASDALVAVQVADMTIVPEDVEAGTGFYEHKFTGSEIKPEMGRVTVSKPDAGVSWGSLHWQYLESIDKITPTEGNPLKLEKKLYKRILKETGPVLVEVDGKDPDGSVSVGEELVCRVVLRTDRDMEYVHLKDYRGSGTEPVNVLSRYKFQDGLFYYESTRDTATHFFIDYLRKGTYVFEYALRVQHAGDYPMGYASIQCMYAPEFNSHSESIQLRAK